MNRTKIVVVAAMVAALVAGCSGKGNAKDASAAATNASSKLSATTVVPGGMTKTYDDSSLDALAKEAEAVAVVQVTRSRVRPTETPRVFRIATAKVTEVLMGPLAVGDVVDVRQNDTGGGVTAEHEILAAGRSYVLYMWDAQWPNDEDRPLYHAFGVFGSQDDGRWADLGVEKTLPSTERVVTLDDVRASLRKR